MVRGKGRSRRYKATETGDAVTALSLLSSVWRPDDSACRPYLPRYLCYQAVPRLYIARQRLASSSRKHLSPPGLPGGRPLHAEAGPPSCLFRISLPNIGSYQQCQTTWHKHQGILCRRLRLINWLAKSHNKRFDQHALFVLPLDSRTHFLEPLVLITRLNQPVRASPL